MDLLWIGSPEQCDVCHETYPMSWIIYDGRFMCYACAFPSSSLSPQGSSNPKSSKASAGRCKDKVGAVPFNGGPEEILSQM